MFTRLLYYGATEKVVLEKFVEATWNTLNTETKFRYGFRVPRKENHVGKPQAA